MANVLFDLGSTYYYLSMIFSSKFYLVYDVIDSCIHVCTSLGESVIVTHVYRACPILFICYHTWANLVSPLSCCVDCNTKSNSRNLGKEKFTVGRGVHA